MKIIIAKNLKLSWTHRIPSNNSDGNFGKDTQMSQQDIIKLWEERRQKKQVDQIQQQFPQISI